MSNEARQWAWSLPDLPTPVRLLLVALAEHVPDLAPAEDGRGSASAAKQGRGPRKGTDLDRGPQGSRRGNSTRRGTRDETDERLAEKDYTVGATRDEDLPDWASGWRDRTPVAE